MLVLRYVLGDDELTEDGSFLEPERSTELHTLCCDHGSAARLSRTLFDLIDADGSGELGAQEAKLFFSLQGKPEEALEGCWQELLASADSSGDLKVSKLEFISFNLAKYELGMGGDFVAYAVRSHLPRILNTLDS